MVVRALGVGSAVAGPSLVPVRKAGPAGDIMAEFGIVRCAIGVAGRRVIQAVIR
jgi:hypothetical protein